MTTFIYIPGELEQVWACISWLHLYCKYLEMIKVQFVIGQHFLGCDIVENVILGTPHPTPKHQNDVIKDKIDSWVFPKYIGLQFG